MTSVYTDCEIAFVVLPIVTDSIHPLHVIPDGSPTLTEFLKQETLANLPPAVSKPSYNRTAVKKGIVHIGVGHFHRSHQALAIDRLLNKGLASDWAICGAGIMPSDDRMAKVMLEQDCLYTLVEKDNDGSMQTRVIGSIVEYIAGKKDPEFLLQKLANPETRIVTLTITEGGYNFDQTTGEFIDNNPDVLADLMPGATPVTVFGFVVEALRRRRDSGFPPFTILSCDNIQHNGDVASRMFRRFAELKDPGLAAWIKDNVRFPNSMVDRITPATLDQDIEAVESLIGLHDEWPVIAEPFFQWVIEDNFSMGRPPFEEAGVQMVDDVEPYEAMKIRILNGGHQTLAYFGFLGGHTYVHEAASDPLIGGLLKSYMQTEAVPTLKPVPGVDLQEYVLSGVRRFQNPTIKDPLSRICAFTSDRIPKFLLPVVTDQLRMDGSIVLCAAVVASWARYAEGSDEAGKPIDVVDQLAEELVPIAQSQRANRLAFIENRALFGDLVDNERFREHYLSALDSLIETGANRTVSGLIS